MVNANSDRVCINGLYFDCFNYYGQNTCRFTADFNGVASSTYTGKIEIPSSITYQNVTYTVRKIGANVFYNSGVTSVYLPSTITECDPDVFYGATNLKYIVSAIADPPQSQDDTHPYANNIFGSGLNESCVLIVPYGTKSTYVTKSWTKNVKGGVYENAYFKLDNKTRSYGDANPTLTFSYATLENIKSDPTYSCNATNTSPVGNYQISFDNKVGVVESGVATFVDGTLTITKAPLTITAKSYTIKQGEALPTYEATYSGFKNGQTSSVLTTQPILSCSATSTSAPATYDITPSGAAAQNYSFTYVKGTLTITEADPITVTANSYTRVYGEANPAFGYTSSGGTLNGTPSISCAATATSPVGTYPITISQGTITNTNVTYVKGTLSINPKNASNLTINSISARTYNGSAQTPTVTVKDGTTTLTSGTHYTVDYSNNTNAGTATVTITGMGNYTGTKNASFTINPKNASNLTINSIAAQTYSGSAKTPTVTVKDGNTTLTSGTHYTVSYSNNINAGTATVIVTGMDNYTGTKNANFTINPKNASNLSISDIAAVTYNGLAQTPTVTVKDGTTTLTSGTHYTVAYSNNTNAGTATVTITGTGNYTGTKNANFTINKAPLTITANSYNINQGDVLPSFAVSYSGFKNSETSSVLTTQPTISCSATSGSAPGIYDITVSGAAAHNYSFNYVNGTLTIEANNIQFADANVKAICIAHWDTNSDGELSYDEAAAVTDLGEVFTRNTEITSFNELQYFTGLTSIGRLAFYYCFGLTSITIPNSVTSIGNFAFEACFGLTSITIPNSVTSIGQMAFWGCTNLTSITIPNSVTSIGQEVFDGCPGLTSIVVENENTNYDSREDCNAIIETNTNTLIAGCKNTIIPNSVTSIGSHAFDDCSGLTSITIPNSVTSIGQEAFRCCSNLTSVTIPNSVTSIGNFVFEYCSSLTSVTVDINTPLAITSNTFSNRANATLYVPKGSKAAYQAADYWKEFKEIIEISLPTHKLIYVVDGEEYKAYDIEEGDPITPEAEPTKETYMFSGWSEIPSTMPTHDVTVTGTFERHFTVEHLVKVIGFIMNSNATPEDLALYDVNNDSELNIGDIILIVKNILNQEPVSGARLADRRASTIVDFTQYTAAQFELKVENNAAVKDIRLVSSMAQTHRLMYQQKDANTYNVVIFSMSNLLMKPKKGCIVEIDGGDAVMQNILVATPLGETSFYQNSDMPTGISQQENSEKPSTVYDLKGNRQNGMEGLRKGIYIINGKKVVVR